MFIQTRVLGIAFAIALVYEAYKIYIDGDVGEVLSFLIGVLFLVRLVIFF